MAAKRKRVGSAAALILISLDIAAFMQWPFAPSYTSSDLQPVADKLPFGVNRSSSLTTAVQNGGYSRESL